MMKGLVWSPFNRPFVYILQKCGTIRLALRLLSTMSHTVLFPVRNFFYPHWKLPKKRRSSLLGCGNPRNVPFTIYNRITVDPSDPVLA